MTLEEEIKQKFIDNGDRLAYQDLVACYKNEFLNDETFKIEFKKTVKRLASIKEENGQKILVLKPKHNPTKKLPDGLKSSILEALRLEPEDSSLNISSSYSFAEVGSSPSDKGNNSTSPIPEIKVTDSELENQAPPHYQISDGVISSNETNSSDFKQPFESTKVDPATYNVEDRSSCDSKESTPDLLTSQQSSKSNRSANFKTVLKELSSSSDNCSVASISLSSDERNWLCISSKCDYTAMAKSLTKNPDLALCQDFTSGYNALHWAAKVGNLAAINLLAGNYRLDVDRRTHGGYTPLHLAAMHGHYNVMELLIKNYGACQTIRDNGGRKAEQYVNNAFKTKYTIAATYAAHHIVSSTPLKGHPSNLLNHNGRTNPKTANFMQILYPVKVPSYGSSEERDDENSTLTVSDKKATRVVIKSCNSLPNALNLCFNKQERVGSLRLSKIMPKVAKRPASPNLFTKSVCPTSAEPVEFRDSHRSSDSMQKHKSTEV